MKLAALAVFSNVNCGAFTGVLVVLVQRAAAGQVGSPPPLTVAVFTAGEAAARVGVTGITKLVLPPAPKGEPASTFRIDPEDDIVTACLMAHEGAVTRKA